MKYKHLRLIILLFLLLQSACLDVVSGLLGTAAGGSPQGSTSNSDTSNAASGSGNQIISDGEADADGAGSVGDGENSSDAAGVVEIGPGIAKLERGSISALGVYAKTSSSAPDTVTTDVATTDAATDSTEVPVLVITGVAGTITGECSAESGECAAELVIFNGTNGNKLERTTANVDGSFTVELPLRFKSRPIGIAVMNQITGEFGNPIIVNVHSSTNFIIGITQEKITTAETRLGIGNGMVIYNEETSLGEYHNRLVAQKLDGSDKVTVMSDAQVLDQLSLTVAGTIFGEYRDAFLLGTTLEDKNTFMLEKGDSELTFLDDVPNHTFDPVIGRIKNLEHVDYAKQPQSAFIATVGIQQGSSGPEPYPIVLIPTVENTQPNDIYIRGVQGNLNQLRGPRTLAFKDNSHLIAIDDFKNGNYVAKILDIGAFTSKTPAELVAFKQTTPGVINVPIEVIFTTTMPISKPVMAPPVAGMEPFFAFTCKLDGSTKDGICVNYFDNEIVELTDDDGDNMGIDINTNAQFIVSSRRLADGDNNIVLIYMGDGEHFGESIWVTQDVPEKHLDFVQPTFSDIDPSVLTHIAKNVDGSLTPAVINLRFHPLAGKYIPESDYCDPEFVTCTE